VQRRYAAGGRALSLVRRRANLRVRVCAWVRTVVGDERLGLRSGVCCKEAAWRRPWRSSGRLQGWRRTRQPQLGTNARVCGSDGRWRGVHSTTKKDGAPSSATACTKQAPTERPWRRGRQERNIEVRRKKRGQRPSFTIRARARACWGARLRESDMPARARA
jgi:hypothetical protein